MKRNKRKVAKSFLLLSDVPFVALRKLPAKRPACTERRSIFGRMARWWQRSRDKVAAHG